MNMQSGIRTTCGLAMSLAMFASLGVPANAQDAAKAGGQQATVQGLVIGRDGSTMLVRTADTPKVDVELSDSTKATQKGGFLGLSRKDLGITQLVPGMQVKVEGSYDSDHKLVAKKVTFSRGSYETAQQIDAGLNPTNEKVAKQQDQLRSDRRDIEQGQSDLASAKSDISTTQQGLAANVQATGENKQAIGQTNTRIGTLDQYVTKDTLTVNFPNGRSAVAKKDKDALSDFVKAGRGYSGSHGRGAGLCFGCRRGVTQSAAEQRTGQQCAHDHSAVGCSSDAHPGSCCDGNYGAGCRQSLAQRTGAEPPSGRDHCGE